MNSETDKPYIERVVDVELDELLPALPAVSLEGPKAVGKTSTALRRAETTWELDDPAQRETITADPNLITEGEPPILIDEWQRVPETWDIVRRTVDASTEPGCRTFELAKRTRRRRRIGYRIADHRPDRLSTRGRCRGGPGGHVGAVMPNIPADLC